MINELKYNVEKQCLEVRLKEITILLDIETLNLIHYTELIKLGIDEEHIYIKQKNNVYLLEIIFNVPYAEVMWKFINGNKFDCRKSNIEKQYIVPTKFPTDLTILNIYKGHYTANNATKLFNTYYEVENNIKEKYYVINCGKDIYCYVSNNAIKPIIQYVIDNKSTWYVATNFKIICNVNKQIIYMDKLICEINNKLTSDNNSSEIKHINLDKFDNRNDNLLVINTTSINNLNNNINIIDTIADVDITNIIDKIKQNKNINILQYYNGHIKSTGKSANKEMNPYFKVSENDAIYYIMYCKPNTLCYFSVESLDIVTNSIQSWYLMSNGYIGCHNSSDIYLHRLIMQSVQPLNDPYFSVDHINHNKLDNRINNLRWTTQSEQNMNTGKRERKHNAQLLPVELTDKFKEKGISGLPKFVNYYKEEYNKDKQLFRQWFKIEKHPLQHNDEEWNSRKSNINNNDLLDLYEDTLYKIQSMNNECLLKNINKYAISNDNIYSVSDTVIQRMTSVKPDLPIGFRSNETHIILDKRICKGDEIIKYNLKMKYDDKISMDENLKMMYKKTVEKYPDEECFKTLITI